MKRGRGEDQSDVVSGKEIVFPQTVSEGVELSNKFGVRKAVAFSSIDDESSAAAAGGGGGGAEEGKSILWEGERLIKWWMRYFRSETVKGSRLRTKACGRINRLAVVG